MEFESNHEHIRNAFMSILTTGVKNNTYKFALARFLLDYSQELGSPPLESKKLKIKYTEIAKEFFRYYWMQECKSHLRQGPINQPPEIITIIRDEFREAFYPQSVDKIIKKELVRVENCILRITKKCFDDVIPRFEIDAEAYFGRQRSKPPHSRILYNYWAREQKSKNFAIDPNGGIELNPHALSMLQHNYEPLYRSVILEWIRFLERRNFGVPHLVQKIEAREMGPRDQARFKKYLEPFTDSCFYCSSKLLQGRCTHVDHVIPYDYVGDTELWNLVLACQKCNCEKSGHLPPEQHIMRLQERNEEYRGQIKKLEKSLTELEYGGYDVCWHYNNAASFGYAKLDSIPRQG